MKIHPSPHSSRRAGSVLVVTLMIGMIIGLTLAAFMDLSSAQHRSVIRSGVWNSCVPLAEAGLEEAFTHAFRNSTNLGSQGWSTSTTGLIMSNGVTLSGTVYYRSRSLNGGNYLAAIQGGTTPTFTVQGGLPKPLTTNDLIFRTIQVRTVGSALFARGLVARGTINWNGGILSDSFDSQDPTYSSNGRYNPARRNANGSIGSVEGNVDVGSQGTIYGSVGTGPAGRVTTGPSSAVGDAAFIAGGGTGIQAGHSENDLNIAFPDATLPFTTGYTIPAGGNVTNYTVSTNSITLTSLSYPTTAVGAVTTNAVTSTIYPTGTPYSVTTNVIATRRGSATTFSTNFTFTQFNYSTNALTTNTTTTYYSHILDNGDYYLSGISSVDILVRGNARLWVDGSVSQSGSRAITINGGATLQMWVGGSISLSGQSTVNGTGDAMRLSVYGLPSCTSVSISGNSEFTGTLYAPQAHMTYNGGGMDRADFMGAAIVGSAQLNGHFEFHYDENLGRNGPSSSFVIDSWSEI